MALKKIIELEGDIFVNTAYGSISTGTTKLAITAYIKVSKIAGNKDNLNIEVNFSDENIEFNKLYALSVSTEANAPNFIKQAYEYLKTLPEFENSEDC
jgi:hypothetical protein